MDASRLFRVEGVDWGVIINDEWLVVVSLLQTIRALFDLHRSPYVMFVKC